ncbi:MAG: CHC2 zinc finger domain-containing protein [Longimicrobiales bacterium]
MPAWIRADPERAISIDRNRAERWARLVEAARSLGILDVARRLDCGDPVRRGREFVVRCPLHRDETPSCRLDPTSNVWFCDPCAEGGDALALFMRARRLDFGAAVRELVL